jgi:plasmid stabilization system protein ParE
MSDAFHPEAEAELEASIDYYEECEPGLGIDFAAEVYATVQRILAYPLAWPVLEQGIRRALVHRFPYGVLYALADSRVYILAVMHLHRQPGYWKSRIG